MENIVATRCWADLLIRRVPDRVAVDDGQLQEHGQNLMSRNQVYQGTPDGNHATIAALTCMLTFTLLAQFIVATQRANCAI